MTLLSDLTRFLAHYALSEDTASLIAERALTLINSHPETVERRRKDFLAGQESLRLDVCSTFEDHLDEEASND